MNRRSFFSLIAAAITGRKQIIAAAQAVPAMFEPAVFELPPFEFSENMARALRHAERILPQVVEPIVPLYPFPDGTYTIMVDMTLDEFKKRYPDEPRDLLRFW